MQYYAQDDKPLLIFFISKNGDTGNNQNYLKVVHWKKSLRNEQRCDNHFIDFYKEYMYCEASKPPNTKIITINKYGDLINFEEYVFGQEVPPHEMETHTTFCGGDSGAGQFTASTENRYALVAVHTSSGQDKFVDDKGEIQYMPCGSYSYDAERSKDSTGVHNKRAYLQTYGMSESITRPETLKWIKQRLFDAG